MSWFSCRRNAAIRASLRRKNTHCPTFGGRDQAGALQHGQMREHRRLGQSAAAVDVAGADAMLEGMARAFLEIRLGILQPRQDLAAHRVGERLEDGVGVDGWSSPAEAEFEGSGFIFKYRNLSNHISLKIDICSYPRDEWGYSPHSRASSASSTRCRPEAASRAPSFIAHPAAQPPDLAMQHLALHAPALRGAGGRVGRRGFSVRAAARTMAIRRSIASARFFSWLRNACDLMTMTPSWRRGGR